MSLGKSTEVDEKKKRPYETYLFALFFLLVICASLFFFVKPSLPELASNRFEIDKLFSVLFISTGSVYFLVLMITGWFLLKYNKSTSKPALYLPENTKLEITWTLITALILFSIAAFGAHVWKEVSLTPPPLNAMAVEAVGQQFAWTFRYPSPDGIFAPIKPQTIGDNNPLALDKTDPHAKTNLTVKSDLYLPVNKPVRIFIRSTDVIHSFFLPNFRVKQDAVPGMTVETSFTPTKIGDFEIACAQLCGNSHYMMHGKLHILTEENFENKIQELRKSMNIASNEGVK